MLRGVPNEGLLRQEDGAPRVAVLIADPHPGTRSAIRNALKAARHGQSRRRGSGPPIGHQGRLRWPSRHCPSRCPARWTRKRVRTWRTGATLAPNASHRDGDGRPAHLRRAPTSRWGRRLLAKRRRPRPTQRTVRRSRTPTPGISAVSVTTRYHTARLSETPSLGAPSGAPASTRVIPISQAPLRICEERRPAAPSAPSLRAPLDCGPLRLDESTTSADADLVKALRTTLLRGVRWCQARSNPLAALFVRLQQSAVARETCRSSRHRHVRSPIHASPHPSARPIRLATEPTRAA